MTPHTNNLISSAQYLTKGGGLEIDHRRFDTAAKLLRYHATCSGDQPAIIDLQGRSQRVFSWRQLWQRCWQAALVLSAIKLQPGDRILHIGTASTDSIALAIAARIRRLQWLPLSDPAAIDLLAADGAVGSIRLLLVDADLHAQVIRHWQFIPDALPTKMRLNVPANRLLDLPPYPSGLFGLLIGVAQHLFPRRRLPLETIEALIDAENAQNIVIGNISRNAGRAHQPAVTEAHMQKHAQELVRDLQIGGGQILLAAPWLAGAAGYFATIDLLMCGRLCLLLPGREADLAQMLTLAKGGIAFLPDDTWQGLVNAGSQRYGSDSAGALDGIAYKLTCSRQSSGTDLLPEFAEIP